MKKIVITGGSGFIGKNLLENISSKKNYKIFCFLNKKKIKLKNIVTTKVSLFNHNLLRKKINEIKPDIFIHLAAYINPHQNQLNQKKSQKINFLATKNLCKYLNRNCHFIFLSTDKVYGNKNKNCKETDKVNPTAEYAKNKFKSEQLITKKFLNYHIFRLPIVHGYGDPNSSSFIDKAIIKKKASKKISVAKNIFRSFLYLDQLILIIIKSLNSNKYGLYNLGSKRFSYYTRLKSIFSKNKLDYKTFLKPDVNKNIFPLIQILNSSKIKKNFNIKIK
tara:strand:- start:27 stop:857 length:831 start_codon:yes stop_codon:yes gene_type:complete